MTDWRVEAAIWTLQQAAIRRGAVIGEEVIEWEDWLSASERDTLAALRGTNSTTSGRPQASATQENQQ